MKHGKYLPRMIPFVCNVVEFLVTIYKEVCNILYLIWGDLDSSPCSALKVHWKVICSLPNRRHRAVREQNEEGRCKYDEIKYECNL